MNGTQGNRKNLIEMLGMAALIVVLVFAAQLVFRGLGTMGPQREPNPYTVLNGEDGKPGQYSLAPLVERGEDVERWLALAKERSEDSCACWLFRQDTGESILYLPTQDRELSAEDFTATEEVDRDGEASLALRIRTPEGSGEADPAQQLFSIQTTSEKWNGVRVRVILDGRELALFKLISIGGELYSSEQADIGRG